MSLKDFFDKKPKNVYMVSKDNIKAIAPEIVKECIQSMEEGQILDILTPMATQAYSSTYSMYIDKNNYPSYIKQIQVINNMYNNRTDYGGELLRALIDTRVSFIGGEGASVEAQKKGTEDFITDFLTYNKLLEGSNLLKMIILTEMEGKCLLRLKTIKDEDENKIKVIRYSYYTTPYNVTEDLEDKDDYKKVVISTDKLTKDVIEVLKNGGKDKDIKLEADEFVFIKIGGSPDRVNNTPPLIANVLTDIENFSRAKFDMRNNNHLFGMTQPVYLVEDLKEAKSLQTKINSLDKVIGKAYVGTAKQVFYLEPLGRAQECLHKEMIDILCNISTNMKIPIHYLSHPEMLSNRATAENLLEVVNAGILQPRLIIEEALTELVKKAMVIAMEKGVKGAVNDPDGFQIRLNFATLSLLKQIAEVWMPLADAEYVSRLSVMSRLPGINVNKELKQLKKEKEERMADMPTVLKDGTQQNGEDQQEGEEGQENKEVKGDNNSKKKQTVA